MALIERMINEIKTSNLDKLAQQPIRDIITDSVKDLIRILYKKFDDWGYSSKNIERSRPFEDVSIEDLKRGINLTMNDDILLLLELERFNKLTIRVSDNSEVYLSSLRLIFDTKEDLTKALNELHSFIKENKITGNPGKSEKRERRDEINRKYGPLSRIPSSAAKIRDVAEKYNIAMYAGVDQSGYELQFAPKYKMMLPVEINKLRTDLIPALDVIEYSFQIEHLKKVLELAVKRVESNNHFIERLEAGLGVVSLTISTKSGESKLKREFLKLKERHQRNKSRISKLENEYKNLKELSFKEYHYLILESILEGVS